MRGGKRQGAGRKKGFAAKNAEEARAYFSQRVAEETATLVDVLLERAKNGDMRALQILLDRAWGRARQEIEIRKYQNEAVQPTERIYRLAASLNATDCSRL